MERRFTHRDPNQTVTVEHDHELQAKRVVIVGGEMPQITLPPISFDASSLMAPEVKIIEIEKPIIIEKERIVYVDKPYIVEKIVHVPSQQLAAPNLDVKIIEIEKPIVIKETEIKVIETEKTVVQVDHSQISIWIKICLVAQVLISITALLKSLK